MGARGKWERGETDGLKCGRVRDGLIGSLLAIASMGNVVIATATIPSPSLL